MANCLLLSFSLISSQVMAALGLRISAWYSLGVGAVVAVGGLIGFVGLLVPHLVRLLVGPDNRALLPLSALAGALLLTLADVLARLVIAPAELPLGVVTALVGGPFFLMMIVYRRRGRG